MQWKRSWDLKTVPDETFWKEWGRRIAANRKGPPRAKVLRPCPKCGQAYGTVELRRHIPRCSRAP